MTTPTTPAEVLRQAREALTLAQDQLAGDRLELIACHAWPAGSGAIPEHDRAGTQALRDYDETLGAIGAALAAIDALPSAPAWPCHCDERGIGTPGVTCGDCPRDYGHTVSSAPSGEPAADHTALLKMLAQRARCFPSYPIGSHIPEVFDAIGEPRPDRATTAPAPLPRTLTEEQIERHEMPASECPPNSQVILVSSIRRLLGLTEAETSATASVAGLAEPTRADLIAALTFYATGGHFNLSDESAWDTVSGEPQNWWCDEAGTATIEDGSLAKMALAGDMNAEHFAALDRGDDVCIEPGADRAAPQAVPVPAPSDMEDPVMVPRGLIGAACSALNFGRDAPKTLAELRRYTIGDRSSTAAAAPEPVGALAPLERQEWMRVHAQAVGELRAAQDIITRHHISAPDVLALTGGTMPAARPAPAVPAEPDRAWLVEWRWNGVQWLYLIGRRFSFTADPNAALRFARRADAEAALAWVGAHDGTGALRRLGEMLATEHEWVSTTPQEAPAPRALTDAEIEVVYKAVAKAMNYCAPSHPVIARAAIAEFCRVNSIPAPAAREGE